MKKIWKWNKLIGLASILVLVATSFYALSDFNSQGESSAVETKTSQSAEKKKNQNKTAPKTEDTASSDEVRSDLPDVSPDDWKLVMAGPNEKIEQEIPESQLASVPNNAEEKIDSRIVKDYENLAVASDTAGYQLVAVSAFRSIAYQERVFNESVNRTMSQQNISQEEATEVTKQSMTEPGYSEHHTGLAIDVVDADWYNNYQNTAAEMLDEKFGDTPGAKWIAENAPRYGFIISYPKGKENITGITYEPWHLRYVGIESAIYIQKHNLTMQEYVELLKQK